MSLPLGYYIWSQGKPKSGHGHANKEGHEAASHEEKPQATAAEGDSNKSPDDGQPKEMDDSKENVS